MEFKKRIVGLFIKSMKKQIIGVKDTSTKLKETSIELIDESITALAAFALVIQTIFVLIWKLFMLIARVMGIIATVLLYVVVAVLAIAITWLWIWLLISIIYKIIMFLWSIIVAYYAIIFVIATIAVALYALILAIVRQGEEFRKTLFWIWIVLSIIRLIFTLYYGWDVFSKITIPALVFVGFMILLFWALSHDFKKNLLKDFNFEALPFLIIYLIIAYFAIPFIFSLITSHPEIQNVKMAESKKPLKIIENNILKDFSENCKKEYFQATAGTSPWRIFQERGIEADSLLAKSVRFSKNNTLKMYIVTKKNKKIWVSNFPQDSIENIYGKDGKEIISILPLGTELSYEEETQKLRVVKTE